MAPDRARRPSKVVGRGGARRKTPPTKPLSDRLLSRVRIDNETGCWIWTGAISGFGYGVIWSRKGLIRAHRASWMIFKGEIPAGMCVLHSCDVPRCVNPGHLWIGTKRENSLDMAKKGRWINQYMESA